MLDYTGLVQMAVSVSEMYLQFVIESLWPFSDCPLEIQYWPSNVSFLFVLLVYQK